MLFTVHYDTAIHGSASRGLVTAREVIGSHPFGPVVGTTAFFERDTSVGRHWHDHSQLVYAASGSMMVTAQNSFWLVPPHRAVWLPAGIEHAFHMVTAVEMHSIYILSSPPFPDKLHQCCVLQISPLLRELVDRVRHFESPYSDDSPEGRLATVLLDEIAAAPTTPLFAPYPKDPRLQKMAATIAADPRERRTLKDWASQLGASERTIARLFQRDTGMSFVQWRQQVRLLGALQHLSEGRSVTEVAGSFGYDSTSAFIAMFRKNLGTTPSRYFR